MTYARARLWLGITGVGTLVIVAAIALSVELPRQLLSNEQELGLHAVLQLAAITLLFMCCLFPLDFLGGFWLPRKFRKSDQAFGEWFLAYLVAAFTQGLMFVLFGLIILMTGQSFGRLGGAVAVGGLIVICFTMRTQLMLRRASASDSTRAKLLEAIAMIHTWQIFTPSTIAVAHRDVGFTGGIVGLGNNAKIVIPTAWLNFETKELAAAIARRALAIQNGSYSTGLSFAFAWNVGGFLLCSFLPGAGVNTVAGLATTICGFTLWLFLGLLILPTFSRNASLKIDRDLMMRGMSSSVIGSLASNVDQMQDDEPRRPRLIETIFHPIPSVSSRNGTAPVSGFAAWNVARTTLFFSWAGLGFLSRAVHCNVGRPELWTMLPTD